MSEVISSSTVGAGEYTADKLKELKKQAKSYTGPRASSSGPELKEDPDVQPAFKLAGSFKPAAAASDDRFQPLHQGTAAVCNIIQNYTLGTGQLACC